MFLRPLLPYQEKAALLIFEFGAFGRRSFAEPGEFLERLDPFLAALPPEFRYAVEIRNPEYLETITSPACARTARRTSIMPGRKCRSCDARWPSPMSATADFLVCRRCYARGGCTKTRWMLLAYREIQDPNPEARESMRILIGRAGEQAVPVSVREQPAGG